MVIKLLILLVTLQAFAQESTEKIEFLYKSSDFENLLMEIDDRDDINWKRDFLVLEYKALAKEKMGDLDEAIGIFIKLIKTNFKRESSTYINSLIKRRKFHLNFKNKDRLFFYYSKLASLYVEKFEKLNYTSSYRDIVKTKKQARLFIVLLRNNRQYDRELPEYLLSKIDTHQAKIDSYRYHSRFYGYLSFVSWQHKLKFIKNSTNSSSDILSTTVGSCTGLGYSRKNKFFDWNWENCFVVGNSNASTLHGSQNFIQNSVAVSGIYGGPSVMFDDLSEDLSIGLGLNYLYASHDYDTPENTTLDNKSFLRFGYSFRSKWKFSDVAFTLSIGKIFRNESSMFQFIVGYYF